MTFAQNDQCSIETTHKDTATQEDTISRPNSDPEFLAKIERQFASPTANKHTDKDFFIVAEASCEESPHTKLEAVSGKSSPKLILKPYIKAASSELSQQLFQVKSPVTGSSHQPSPEVFKKVFEASDHKQNIALMKKQRNQINRQAPRRMISSSKSMKYMNSIVETNQTSRRDKAIKFSPYGNPDEVQLSINKLT